MYYSISFGRALTIFLSFYQRFGPNKKWKSKKMHRSVSDYYWFVKTFSSHFWGGSRPITVTSLQEFEITCKNGVLKFLGWVINPEEIK